MGAQTPPKPKARPKPKPKPKPPEFVLVHRNTKIRLAPNEEAPYVQFRTPEQQDARETELAEEAAARKQAQAEATAARKEAEAKRAKRLQKKRKRYSKKKRRELAAKDRERAQEARIQRAEARLREIRQRERAREWEGSHRTHIAFRKIGVEKGWVELRPVPADAEPPHCFRGNFGVLDRIDGSFWVREDELAVVVRHRVRVPVYAGSEAILLPGVALEPTKSPDRYVALVDGFEFRLTIPAHSVGTWYRPEQPLENPVTDLVFTARALAEGRLKLGKRSSLPINPYRDLYVTRTLAVGSRFFATTQTPCSEVTVRTSKVRVEPAPPRGTTRLTDDSRVPPPFVPVGTTVTTAQGALLGRTSLPLPLNHETRSNKKFRCFATDVWREGRKKNTDGARRIELCVPAGAVVE